MNAPIAMVDALESAVGFEAQESAGNVRVGRGRLQGRPVRVAIIENRTASGAIGVAESDRLVSLFTVAAAEKSPLVLHVDSAGAKVSEGLRALGGFRRLYRAGLDTVLAGVPIVAVLGRNCFGGGSMVAHLARRRIMGPQTRLAMSGPAVIAAAAGTSPLDEMFTAMAQATMAASARAQANPANVVWAPGSDLAAMLVEAIGAGESTNDLGKRHQSLGARLDPAPARVWEKIRRADLDKLYPAGYEARESVGLIEGRASGEGAAEAFVGLVGRQPVDAARAWAFSDIVWRHVAQPPARLEVYLDCASHAPRLDDERKVLTEFVVDMAFALTALRAAGCRVGLTVVGEAGGGVYVALAAPAERVAALHQANIQVLPGAAVTAILGESRESVPSFDEYRRSGVADEEIKLGYLPGMA